jgi:hypothetical protein
MGGGTLYGACVGRMSHHGASVSSIILSAGRFATTAQLSECFKEQPLIPMKSPKFSSSRASSNVPSNEWTTPLFRHAGNAHTAVVYESTIYHQGEPDKLYITAFVPRLSKTRVWENIVCQQRHGPNADCSESIQERVMNSTHFLRDQNCAHLAHE